VDRVLEVPKLKRCHEFDCNSFFATFALALLDLPTRSAVCNDNDVT
jgi:hypothetical protein